MAHKTKINGTAYGIAGGKTKVGGTAYEISGGRTRINGTAYDIPFALPTFSVLCTMLPPNRLFIFTFEEGMTWSSFINSDYNLETYDSNGSGAVATIIIDKNIVKLSLNAQGMGVKSSIKNSSGTKVTTTDTINVSETYTS